MVAMASQITNLTIVYLIVYSGADQRKYKRSTSLAFVLGIRRWPVNSPHKWTVMRKMFSFDDIIARSEWLMRVLWGRFSADVTKEWDWETRWTANDCTAFSDWVAVRISWNHSWPSHLKSVIFCIRSPRAPLVYKYHVISSIQSYRSSVIGMDDHPESTSFLAWINVDPSMDK